MRLSSIRVLVLTGLVLVLTAPLAFGQWTMTFHDEFDAGPLNAAVWTALGPGFSGAGGGVYQWWLPSNITFVTDAQGNHVMRIRTAKEDADGYHYTSGMVISDGKYAIPYGDFRIEFRAKAPSGYWLWPGLWMMSYPFQIYEPDVMEMWGLQPFFVLQSMHDHTSGDLVVRQCSYQPSGVIMSDAMHIYAMERVGNTWTWFFDGVTTCTLLNWTPSSPESLPIRMQTSVGCDGCSVGTPDPLNDPNTYPQYLDVDYVRVYAATGGPPPPPPPPDETVIVNFASLLGSVATYKASGVRTSAASTDLLVTPVKLRTYRGASPSLENIYFTLPSWGVVNVVRMISSDWTTQGHVGFPGDGGSWTEWTTFLTNLYNADQAAGRTSITYDVWSEPDTSWFPARTQQQFLNAYKQAYNVLRACDANGANCIRPSVKIAAPSPSDFGSGWVQAFVDFCKANNGIYPTVLNWHELGPNAATFTSHAASARSYLTSIGVTSTLSISIDEYGSSSSYLSPGANAKYLAAFERVSALAYASRACFAEFTGTNCDNNSLNGLLTWTGGPSFGPSGEPRSAYWAYQASADIVGSLVTVTPGTSAVAGATGTDGVAGFTAGTAAMSLLGRDDLGGPLNILVRLTNVNSTNVPVGGQVRVVAKYIPNTATVALSAMTPVIDQVYTVVNNEVDVTLPNFGGADAYQVVLLPGSGTVSHVPTPPVLSIR